MFFICLLVFGISSLCNSCPSCLLIDFYCIVDSFTWIGGLSPLFSRTLPVSPLLTILIANILSQSMPFLFTLLVVFWWRTVILIVYFYCVFLLPLIPFISHAPTPTSLLQSLHCCILIYHNFCGLPFLCPTCLYLPQEVIFYFFLKFVLFYLFWVTG